MMSCFDGPHNSFSSNLGNVASNQDIISQLMIVSRQIIINNILSSQDKFELSKSNFIKSYIHVSRNCDLKMVYLSIMICSVVL